MYRKRDVEKWLTDNNFKPIRTAVTKEAGDKVTVYGNKKEALILLETNKGTYNLYSKFDIPAGEIK